MAEPAVANASPLIFLARGGRFDLLRLTGDRVLVPTPVAVEIRRRGSEDVTARALDAAAWIEIIDPPAVPSVISAWDFGTRRIRCPDVGACASWL